MPISNDLRAPQRDAAQSPRQPGWIRWRLHIQRRFQPALAAVFAATVAASFVLKEVWEMAQMSAYVETAGRPWTNTLGLCTRAAVGDVGIILSILMNHTDGWMNGWMGGGMWLWTVIGVVVVVLLVVVINKLSKT